jgi:malonyl CoA-acyl carrier protein transacylase
MQKERWRELCERVVTEVDPEKVGKLLKELARVLGEKAPVVNENGSHR